MLLPSSDTFRQRRRKQIPHFIPQYLRSMKLGQNISVKVYRKSTYTNQYMKHFKQTNIWKTKCRLCHIRPSRQRCHKLKGRNGRKAPHLNYINAIMAVQKKFIQRMIKRHIRRKEQLIECLEEEPEQNKCIRLPYIKGISEQLK